jgi:mRNA-degrading endonuclease toxin of MazEF toxin-antitoxin module
LGEDVRSLSTQRLEQRLGSVSPGTLEAVEVRLRILLGL